jgi:putative endonuclease
MKLSNYQIGLNAEIITSNYLKNKGYSILKHRYKTIYGEIDLIAYKNDLLIFVEVKTRKTIPNYDIILNKQKSRSCEVAMYFLSQYHQFKNFQMRFDCFLIDKYGRFKYIENAWGVSENQLMGVL